MGNQFNLVSLISRKYILINLKDKIGNVKNIDILKGVFMQYEIPYSESSNFGFKLKKVINSIVNSLIDFKGVLGDCFYNFFFNLRLYEFNALQYKGAI